MLEHNVAEQPGVGLWCSLTYASKLDPNRVAVVDDQRRWTYAELYSKADQIANAISKASPTPARRIGILSSHDAWMVASILAALRSGAAYVPLDLSLPPARLAFIARDCDLDLIISSVEDGDILEALKPIPAVMARRCGSASDFNLARPDDPEQVAYILYTSGTTGKPKGVIQLRRNVLYFMLTYGRSLNIAPTDCVTLFSSFGFDAAVMDIFVALLHGATLCLYDIRTKGFGELADWLARENITIWHSTPTVLRHASSDFANTRIRTVVVGGEPALAEDAAMVARLFPPNCTMINGYGPTESSLALQHHIDPKGLVSSGALPVGRPVEGTEVILVPRDTDTYEIAISSKFVAVGYLNQPELTANAFLPHPNNPTTRIYLTGDYARILTNGIVECIGRRDEQVKIRGVRIELAEVEAVLRSHPQVKEVAVAVRKLHSDTGLVAYVVRRGPQQILARDLRLWTRELLPTSMIPSHFIFLSALPITQNGKVDKRALPEISESMVEDECTPPETPTEIRCVMLWADLLGCSRIGLKDNFFELGGHSLLAARFVSMLRVELGLDLPLRKFIVDPTVAGALAAAKTVKDRRGRTKSNQGTLVSIQEGASETALVCIHPICGSIANYVDLAPHLHPDLSIYGIQGSTPRSADMRSQSIKRLAALYAKLIATELRGRPIVLCGWSFGGLVAYEMARELEDLDCPALEVLMIDSEHKTSSVPSGSEEREKWIWRNFFDITVGQDTESLLEDRAPFWTLSHYERLDCILNNARHHNSYSFKETSSVSLVSSMFSFFVPILLARHNYTPRRIKSALTILQASAGASTDLSKSWETFAQIGDRIIVPGDHVAIMRPPGIARTGAAINSVLRRLE